MSFLLLYFSSGEMDLATLVRTMNPCLKPEVYVFITLQHDDTVPSNLYQRFTFRTNTTNRHLFFYDFSPVLPDYYFVSKFHFFKKSVSQYVVLAAGLCFVSECYLFSSVFTFKEKEGKTFVLSRSLVETLGYQFDYPCRMITLEVHSSLSAVGK